MYFMKHTIKGIDLNIIEYTVQTIMSPENAEYSPLFLSFSSVYQARRLLLLAFHALPDHHNSGTEFSLKAKVRK